MPVRSGCGTIRLGQQRSPEHERAESTPPCKPIALNSGDECADVEDVRATERAVRRDTSSTTKTRAGSLPSGKHTMPKKVAMIGTVSVRGVFSPSNTALLQPVDKRCLGHRQQRAHEHQPLIKRLADYTSETTRTTPAGSTTIVSAWSSR